MGVIWEGKVLEGRRWEKDSEMSRFLNMIGGTDGCWMVV